MPREVFATKSERTRDKNSQRMSPKENKININLMCADVSIDSHSLGCQPGL